ncbi:MAG: POTRA domain-containing protein [Verrucomicrobiota bacterium]|jgi:hemolysin activation/secretion protein
MIDRRLPRFLMFPRSRAFLLLWFFCFGILGLAAAEPVSAPNSPGPSPPASAAPHFNVCAYVVEGSPSLPTNTLAPLFSQYIGTNIGLDEIVKAASALQLEYDSQGYPAVSVAFVPEQITDGIVTFNVAQTAIPQIVVAGERYLALSNGVEIVSRPPVAPAVPPVGAITNAAPAVPTNAIPPAANFAATRANHSEMADALAAMRLKMVELELQSKDTRVHVVSTNAGPRFEVDKYLVSGNTILPTAALGQAITNIDGAFGTNVGFDGIEAAVTELGKAYHERGYGLVKVDVPQQKLTNATVKLQVLEGRLADIKVNWIGNRYFSSNNVMRALPSLRTNIVLNVPIFNAELNRANANQDRQIYPVIGPGPEPGSSELTLNVKDRLPVHAKLELNNQASPGTPELRLNGSAVVDNLWQRDQSLGVQYGLSPETYKQGNQWRFYDAPSVANYSAFYRLALGNPAPIEDLVANNPGSFGYSEATRKFNLPPPTGQPELTFFGSRATIDPGLTTLLTQTITPSGQNPSIAEHDVEESPSINEDIGGHLNLPLPASENFQSGFSGGLDFKTYDVGNFKTNIFTITQTNFDANGIPILPPIISEDPSPVPATVSRIEYLPLSLRYDASWKDSLGTYTFGLGLSANLWFDSHSSKGSGTNTTYLNGAKSIQLITSSQESSGYWVIINPSFSREVVIHDWSTLIRMDGQWASEPLISGEQYGAGGVNSVRGYHEGEVFGDAGWHLSLEEQTPPHIVGTLHDGEPLTIRGSAYMDYARVFLLDPQGNPGSTPLWGTGFGLTASVGSHWQAQFLFSWPLLSAGTTSAYQPFFNFALTAQF